MSSQTEGKTRPNVSFVKVHFNCVACKAAFPFHENISYNKLLIGQDRGHFSDIREVNALLIPAKFCGVFHWSKSIISVHKDTRAWILKLKWQEDENFYLVAHLSPLVITKPIAWVGERVSVR